MVAGPLLPTVTSATGVTLVRIGVVMLFVELGSGVGLPMLAGPLLRTARSADAPTAVTTGGVVLLVRFGSAVLPPTLAIFVRLETTLGARTFSVKLVAVAAARLKLVHNTRLPLRAPPPLA